MTNTEQLTRQVALENEEGKASALALSPRESIGARL